MTVPVDLVDPTALKDPVEEFFRQGGIDVSAEPDEEINEKKVALIGVALGASFIVYRKLMQRELSDEPVPATKGAAMKLLERTFYKVAPLWARAALPAAVAAYRLGSYNSKNLTDVQLETLATAYVNSLGKYIHQTSAEAMLDGFQAQLNARWSADIAWERSLTGYGLDGPNTRTYVQSFTEGLKEGYVADPVPRMSAKLVETAIGARAKRFGDTEAWAAVQTGRNVVWMAQEASGDLPPGMRKRWITAKDERVCPVCGPLDGRVIGLKQQFNSDKKKFYAPGVHPNCRCRIELVYPKGHLNSIEELIRKDVGGDPFDRDWRGRFSSTESRNKAPKGWTYRDAAGGRGETHRHAPNRMRQRVLDPVKPADLPDTGWPEPEKSVFAVDAEKSVFASGQEQSVFSGGSVFSAPVRQRVRTSAKPQEKNEVVYLVQTRSGQSLNINMPPPPAKGGKPPTPQPEPIGFLGFSLDNAMDNSIQVSRNGQFVNLDGYDPQLGDVLSFSKSWTEEHGYLFDFGVLGPVSPELQMENADWEEARRLSSRDYASEEFFGQGSDVTDPDSTSGGKTAITFFITDAVGFAGDEDRVLIGHYHVTDVEDLEPTSEQRAVGITVKKRVALEYVSHDDWQVE